MEFRPYMYICLRFREFHQSSTIKLSKGLDERTLIPRYLAKTP